jgi:hypothetical protein
MNVTGMNVLPPVTEAQYLVPVASMLTVAGLYDTFI